MMMKNPTWKILNIGFLRNNLYWDEAVPKRDQACTTTLIETDTRRIVVDPGNVSQEEAYLQLDRYAGLSLEDIDTVFLTHFHRNHFRALSFFKKAVWLMSRAEIRWWMNHEKTTEEEKNLLARIIPLEEHSLPGVLPLFTPGHTHGHTSLTFETREGIIVVAGDAVLTFDHFDNREPSPYAEDQREAHRAIDRIAKIADLVIPGHDNYFVV